MLRSVSSFNTIICRTQVLLQIYRCVQINSVLFSSLCRGRAYCRLWSTQIHWCVAICAVNCTVDRRTSFSHCTTHKSIASYFPELWFVPTPPAFETPIRGMPLECCYDVWYRKSRMVWLCDGEKILKIWLLVLTEFMNLTDRHTDGQTLHDGIGRASIASHSKQEVKVIWQQVPHGGPIPRLGVTSGGRNLCHWIPGVGVPISVP